jgi:ABC-type sulfate transport system substrate-binding protein
VATLALAGDTDALHANGGWIPKDWQKRLPHNSVALHLDHRAGGAPGQPQGHQGLG